MKKYFIAVAFLALIFLPAALKGVEITSGERIDATLTNDNEYVRENKLSFGAVADGSFQTNFEKNFKADFLPRGVYTKTYNQLIFSCFGITNNIIAGKDDCLFEIAYINEYYGLLDMYDFSLPENEKKLGEYLDKAAFISDELGKRGKIFCMCVTPGKCDYMSEYVPDKYKINRKFVRGTDALKNGAAVRGIKFVDLSDSLENFEYPVFYKSGIHWSIAAEQTAAAALAREIGVSAEVSERVIKSDRQIWREWDLYELLNIWQRPKGEYYAFEGITGEKSDKKLLIQGDSFASGLAKELYESGIFSEVNDIFYARHMNVRRDNSQIRIHDWEFKGSSFDDYFNTADAVIIELNCETISTFSSGFVDFLYNYLKNN